MTRIPFTDGCPTRPGSRVSELSQPPFGAASYIRQYSTPSNGSHAPRLSCILRKPCARAALALHCLETPFVGWQYNGHPYVRTTCKSRHLLSRLFLRPQPCEYFTSVSRHPRSFFNALRCSARNRLDRRAPAADRRRSSSPNDAVAAVGGRQRQETVVVAERNRNR